MKYNPVFNCEMDNNVLIILGMHRSGTSLTAQWLHKCGLNLGDGLLEADFSNKNGHYEDLDFLTLHKDILRFNKLRETGLRGNVGELVLNNYFEKKIEYNYYFKKSLHKQWGWKEPRTCLLINKYYNLDPEAKVLVIFRNLGEVRTSLIKRDVKRRLGNLHKQSIINQIKIKTFTERYKTKWAIEQNELYKEVNISYHQQILRFVKQTTPKRTIVCELSSLKQKDEKVLAKLKEWGFSLKKVQFSDVFDSNHFNDRGTFLEPFNQMTEQEEKLYNELKNHAI